MQYSFLRPRGRVRRSALAAAVLCALAADPVLSEPYDSFEPVDVLLKDVVPTYREADLDSAAVANNFGATDMTIVPDSSWSGSRAVSIIGQRDPVGEPLKLEFDDDDENDDPLSLYHSLTIDLSALTGKTGLFIDHDAVQAAFGSTDYDLALSRTMLTVKADEAIRASDCGLGAAVIGLTDAAQLSSQGSLAFKNGLMKATEGSGISLAAGASGLGDTGSYELSGSSLVMNSEGGIHSIGNVTITDPVSQASSIYAEGDIGAIGSITLDQAALNISLVQGSLAGVASVTADDSEMSITAAGNVGSLGAVTLSAGADLSVTSAQGKIAGTDALTANGSSASFTAATAVTGFGDIDLTGSNLTVEASSGIGTIGKVNLASGSQAGFSVSAGALGSMGKVTADGSILTLSAKAGVTTLGAMTLKNGASADIQSSAGSIGALGAIDVQASSLTVAAAGSIGSVGAVTSNASVIAVSASGKINQTGDVSLTGGSLSLSGKQGIDAFGAVTLGGGATASFASSSGALGLIGAVRANGSMLTAQAAGRLEGVAGIEAHDSSVSLTGGGLINAIGDATLERSSFVAEGPGGINSIGIVTARENSDVQIASSSGALGSIQALRSDASGISVYAWDGIASIGDVWAKNGSEVSIASDLSLGTIEEMVVDSSRVRLSNAQQEIGRIKSLRLLKSSGQTPELILSNAFNTAWAQVKVDELKLESGTIRLSAQGTPGGLLRSASAASPLQYGSWLLVKKLSGTPNGTITALGNSVLSLGADPAMLTASRIVKAIGDAATYADGGSMRKATLITTPAGIGSTGGVTVTLGETAGSAGSVTLGRNARVIVDWTLQSALSQGEASDTVHALSEAEIILSGWDGSSQTLSWLQGEEGASVTIVNSNFYGTATLSALGLAIEAKSWSEVPGLHAKNALREVERRTIAASTDPGWSFIADAIDSGDHVGIKALANVIDSAVFLTAAGGVTAALDRALRESERSVLLRRHTVPEGEKHWYAAAWTSQGKAPKVFDGGSGRWGAKIEASGVSLGADVSINSDWSASLAVSGATTDTRTTGAVPRIKGSSTSAAVTLMASRSFEHSELTFALGAAQSQLEAKQTANKHILRTEPEVQSGSAAVLWQGGYSVAGLHVEPYAMLSAHTAKLKKGEISDNRVDTGVSGTGFVNTAAKRVWGEAEAGAGVSAQFSLMGVDIIPRALLGVRGAAGDRAWKVRGCLQSGSACDSASFTSVSAFSARGALGLRLGKRDRVPVMTGGFLGFGAKPDGDKTEPREWMFDLELTYERGSEKETAKGMSVVYRQTF